MGDNPFSKRFSAIVLRSFEEYNPAVASIWFLCVICVVMFCTRPEIMLISFAGAVIFFIVRNGINEIKPHLFFLVMFVVLAVINPLTNHNGKTVLFVINNNPVTFEAFLYGCNSAVMIVGALYWFRSFTQMMTSDKLLYITGRLSPKLSLVLSMSMRFVPLFASQARKINAVQKALGLYKEDTIIDKIYGKLRIFSILATWSLENGIITADSMTARGYGIGKRSQFTNFRMRFEDVILLCCTVVLFVICILSVGRKGLEVQFYPSFEIPEYNFFTFAGIISYFVLVFTPTFIEAEAKIKWRSLKSKI